MEMQTQRHVELVDPKKMEKLPIINMENPSKKIDEKEEKYLRQTVTYEFMNLEEPGVPHTFPYGNSKNRYTFTLLHGGRYKLPRFIARHIESRSTPIWKWMPDGTGSMIKSRMGVNQRFQMREVYEG